MKRYFSLVIVLGFLFLFPSFFVHAQDGITEQMLEETQIQMEKRGVSSNENRFTENSEAVANGTWSWSLSGILNYLMRLIFGEINSNLGSLIKMIVVAILAGILCNLQGSFAKDSIQGISFLTCFIIIAGLSVGVFSDIMAVAENTIDTLHLFMQGLIPSVGMMISASGGAIQGATISPTLFVCMQTITYLSKNFFLPFNLMICALSVINNVTERFHITRLIDFARQILKWSIGILLTVYVGLLGLEGFSFGYLNGVAGKTVKFAVCNFIPLVGGALSESVEAVCASASVVKNAVGIAGVLSMVSICLLPMIKLLALSVLYRFAAGVAEPVTDRRISGLLGDVAGNITQTFVILLMVSVMFIISVGLLCSFTNLPMKVN